MSRNKHRQSGHTPIKLPADDLECNPGIGASRGATLSGAGDLGADVENDVTPQGGINPEQRSRGH